MYYLKDGPTVLGFGRDLEEAVRQACDINCRVRSTPRDAEGMMALIDAGVIKVRETLP